MKSKTAANIIVLFMILAVVLLVLGFAELQKSTKIFAEFDNVLLSPLFKTQVDLSKPGNYSGKFTSYDVGSTFYFDSVEQIDSKDKTKGLKGVEGTLTISDSNDKTIESVSLSDIRIQRIFVPLSGPNKHPSKLSPGLEINLHRGQYQYSLNLVKGDPTLSGKVQYLAAQREICGMEYFGAAMVSLIARFTIGAGILLIILSAFVFCFKFYRNPKPPVISS